MSKLPLFCISFLLLVAGGALAQDVRYNFDNTADFSKFKTYKWVALKDARDDITDKQIKAALDAALSQKGLARVEADTADLYIGYQAAVSTGRDGDGSGFRSLKDMPC